MAPGGTHRARARLRRDSRPIGDARCDLGIFATAAAYSCGLIREARAGCLGIGALATCQAPSKHASSATDATGAVTFPRRETRGGEGLDRETQELIAKRWLEKYGEPIDCYELGTAASLSGALDLERQIEIRRLACEYLGLLEDQARERRDFLAKRLPHRAYAVTELLKPVEARGDANAGAREPGAFHAFRELFDGTLVELRQDQLNVLAAKEPWTPLHESYAPHLARSLPSWAQRHKSYRDYSVGRAAYRVSAWVRERHRNPAGWLFDGKVSWLDVSNCLEWHGHDLSALRDRPSSLRLAAHRWLIRTADKDGV